MDIDNIQLHYILPLGFRDEADIMTTVSVERLNLWLVCASEYLSRFQLDICHKPGKAHFVPDALSWLPSSNSTPLEDVPTGELDALHGTSIMLVQICEDFKDRIKARYNTDQFWRKVLLQLCDNTKLGPNTAQLPFELEDGLIYRTTFSASMVCHLCIPQACLGELFKLSHGD